MAFSLGGIFAVLLELVRPLWPWLALVFAVELVVLGVLLGRHRQRAALEWRRARSAALLIGALGGALACVFALWWTQAGLDDLAGLLDFLSLIAVGLGAGIVLAVLTWPVLTLLQTPRAS